MKAYRGIGGRAPVITFALDIGQTINFTLKLYIITPTPTKVTNKRILVKDIRYNLLCFGALTHNHQGKNIKNTEQQNTRWLDGALVEECLVPIE
jgi:hypothetical protein